MRHRVKGRKLKRTASHRAALMKNLAASLLKHKRIKTTLAKAKELRVFIEPLITKAKVGDLHNQRVVMSRVRSKESTKELFNEIVPAVAERSGGYTRIVKLGTRAGDAAEMAIIELVDFNEANNQKAKDLQENKEAKKEQKKEKEATAAQQAQA